MQQYDYESYHTFLYGLLARNVSRRRFILWQWLGNYQPQKETTLLRDVWSDIIDVLLFKKSAFAMDNSKLLLLGPAFPIRFEWLTVDERRNYIVGQLFAKRLTLFKSVSVYHNNTVYLDGFLPELSTSRDAIDAVWRRQWIRDIASWIALSGGDIQLEFICAVQRTAIRRGDVFLSELYATLNGHGLVLNLSCWGHGPEDKVRPIEEEEGEGKLKALSY